MRAHLKLTGLALVVAAAWLAGSCSENPVDVLIPNRPPAVAISAGPIRDSVDVFIVTFNWNASDGDGQVSRFLYAIDDTARASDWFETTAYEITLLFTVSDTGAAGIDSIYVGLSDVPIERFRFRGAHTFFLKAIDDDGARSATAGRSFTAETFAPETQIQNPSPSVIVSLGATFTVSWQGVDPDGTENPVGYSYRVVPVPDVLDLTPARAESVLYADNPLARPWSPFEPRTSRCSSGSPSPRTTSSECGPSTRRGRSSRGSAPRPRPEPPTPSASAPGRRAGSPSSGSAARSSAPSSRPRTSASGRSRSRRTPT
jgi:hypothetical protein